MADNNEEGRINVDSFDFANEGASEETCMLVSYLITRLQQAMENPVLQGEVQQQLQAYGFIPPHQEERIPEKSLGETSKRGISKINRDCYSENYIWLTRARLIKYMIETNGALQDVFQDDVDVEVLSKEEQENVGQKTKQPSIPTRRGHWPEEFHTYISEEMLGMLLARELKPEAPIKLVNFLVSTAAQQTDMFPHMGLYKTGWNTIVNDREKQQSTRQLKEVNDLEMKLKLKDQQVQSQEERLKDMEEQLSKAQKRVSVVLNVEQAKVMVEEQCKHMNLKLNSRQQQNELKEEQLKRARRHKELLEQSILSKYLVQSLHAMEEQLSKAQKRFIGMEYQLLNVQQAKGMVEEQCKQMSLKFNSRQQQIELKEEQLKRARRHKELLEQSILSKYLVQSLQDISFPRAILH
ncbi:hypothetical protein L7F22_044700 [Adiantum nelumboides]|nr:hypothetical protein [Adiantum nelumboides]